jgi:hypothetical protein
MNTGSKIAGLVAMAVMAMAFLGASSAMAETTALCKADENPCSAGNIVTHVHETTLAGAKAILLAKPEVKCDVLFLGDALNSGLGNPLVLHGNLTYSNCEGGCTAVEENGPTELKVLREASELAKVTSGTGTGAGLVHLECPGGVDCFYVGSGLVGHALGPLTAGVETNGQVSLSDQTVAEEDPSFFCPDSGKLDIKTTPLSATYIAKGNPPPPDKTALCTTDEAASTCLEERKPSTVDFKDSAVEFLTNLLSFKCEGLVSGSVEAAGKPQEVKAEHKYSSCTNSCVVTEVGGGSKLFFLLEGELSKELASATTGALELFVKCGTTIKCTFGPIEMVGHALGALASKDNGHITFSKDSLGTSEGATCPSEASLDALFVASSATYLREDYVKPPTSLCSKDEGSPICKSENQLKTIDYKDKAVEILTSLINVKCEGLVSGTVGTPANGSPLEVKAELTYTGCSGGCFVTSVAGPGKIMLERSKSEEAKATSEGFEIFVKCGTTIKCLLGPEKMAGTALGALTTGDNGHLTFSKVSMGKGEGATCPSKAELDALYVASSAAYIG